mmetsp:Transcript_4950/g.7501  ORF Transcript_4950/g.7501 Transcript_4950/m.7501 type:complete len:86 (-) Transcript_4950:129-386(-)
MCPACAHPTAKKNGRMPGTTLAHGDKQALQPVVSQYEINLIETNLFLEDGRWKSFTIVLQLIQIRVCSREKSSVMPEGVGKHKLA